MHANSNQFQIFGCYERASEIDKSWHFRNNVWLWHSSLLFRSMCDLVFEAISGKLLIYFFITKISRFQWRSNGSRWTKLNWSALAWNVKFISILRWLISCQLLQVLNSEAQHRTNRFQVAMQQCCGDFHSIKVDCILTSQFCIWASVHQSYNTHTVSEMHLITLTVTYLVDCTSLRCKITIQQASKIRGSLVRGWDINDSDSWAHQHND